MISANDSSFGSVSTDLVTFELAMALLGVGEVGGLKSERVALSSALSLY